MEEDQDKTKENHERDVSYNTTKRTSDKIQKERSVDLENNHENEEDIKEKIIERMIEDRNNNIYSKTEDRPTKENTSTLSSTENRTIYDLQTLLSQRQDRLWSVLYERYQYNTSIKSVIFMMV